MGEGRERLGMEKEGKEGGGEGRKERKGEKKGGEEGGLLHRAEYSGY